MTGWLVGWLLGWLAGWLAGRLAGWLARCLAVCLAGWLLGRLGGWPEEMGEAKEGSQRTSTPPSLYNKYICPNSRSPEGRYVNAIQDYNKAI